MRTSFFTVLGTATILLLAGFGCDRDTLQKFMPPSPPMEDTISSPDGYAGPGSPLVSFGKELAMSEHTKVGFNDGLTMEVISVSDTRCPEGTKCEKPGEITVTVQLAGGKVGAIPKQVTVVKPGQVSSRQDGYVLFLGNAYGTVAYITLSKERPAKPKADVNANANVNMNANIPPLPEEAKPKP